MKQCYDLQNMILNIGAPDQALERLLSSLILDLRGPLFFVMSCIPPANCLTEPMVVWPEISFYEFTKVRLAVAQESGISPSHNFPFRLGVVHTRLRLCNLHPNLTLLPPSPACPFPVFFVVQVLKPCCRNLHWTACLFKHLFSNLTSFPRTEHSKFKISPWRTPISPLCKKGSTLPRSPLRTPQLRISRKSWSP